MFSSMLQSSSEIGGRGREKRITMSPNRSVHIPPKSRVSTVYNRLAKKRAAARRRGIMWGGAVLAGVLLYAAGSYITENLEMREFIPEDERKNLVVVGSGWASLSFLRWINTDKYNVVVVSPRNYFLFSPLLPSAAVGKVDLESMTEPLRNFALRFGRKVTFFEASAKQINHKEKTIRCETAGQKKKQFDVTYDALVLAVGGATYDPQGAMNHPHCHALRTPRDVDAIRDRVLNCCEIASLPTTNEEDKKKLMSIVVVGGSPSATETVAHLYDLYHQELARDYPHLKDYVNITHIPTKQHIRNIYDKTISDWAVSQFSREGVNCIKGEIVSVTADKIKLDMEEEKETQELPYGLCIWQMGNSIHPLISKFKNSIGKPEQSNDNALVTNKFLKVKGTEDIYAMGDCATVDQGKLFQKWKRIFEGLDKDGDGFIDPDEFSDFVSTMGRQYPALFHLQAEAEALFESCDTNRDGKLEMSEFQEVLKQVDSRLTRFPATATVASQQGKFLAQTFNRDEHVKPSNNDPGFQYKHIGGYEYVGAEDGFVERGSKSMSIISGPGAWWLWRSVFYSKLVGARQRIKWMSDWSSSTIFGNELTRYTESDK